MFEKFINSNTMGGRFARTVAQGLIAALIVFVPDALGYLSLDPAVQTFGVAAIMAVLSPLMALLQTGDPEGGEE